MNNKKFLRKTLSILVACGAVATFGNSTLAQPPGTPTATDNMSFAGNVGFECSVDDPSAFTTAGGTVGTNDIAYDTTSATSFTSGGATGDINDGTPLEDRFTSLSATDTIVFDCNSDTVDLSVTLNNITAPGFTNADNIDLVGNNGETGILHQVDVNLNNSAGTPTFDDVEALAGAEIIDDAGAGANQATDLNGDLEVDLTSNFILVNGAEELGAGDYTADFTIQVTAN